MNVTTENLCNALSLSWTVGHKARGVQETIDRWRLVCGEIAGIMSMLIYCDGPYEEMKYDLRLLREIAEYHAFLGPITPKDPS